METIAGQFFLQIGIIKNSTWNFILLWPLIIGNVTSLSAFPFNITGPINKQDVKFNE